MSVLPSHPGGHAGSRRGIRSDTGWGWTLGLAAAAAGVVAVTLGGPGATDVGSGARDAVIAEISDASGAQPVARLAADRYLAEPGQAIRFDAADSEEPGGELMTYRWDFDADGRLDAETADPVVTHAYPGPYDGLMTLTVVTTDGRMGRAVAFVEVAADDPGPADSADGTTTR